MLTSFRIAIRAARTWSANGDSMLGAALAYYALFSIAPMLVIAIDITGIVYGGEAAQGEVKKYLSTYIEPDSAGAIESLVLSSSQSESSTMSQVLSLGLLVYGALGAFVHLRTSLGKIWKLEPPISNTILATLIDYALALLMVLITGVLLLASVAASLAVSFLQEYLAAHYPDQSFPWQWVEFAVSVSFLTLLFAAIYRILSGRRIEWKYVAYGSMIASVLFTAGKVVLSQYIVYSGTASTYGAAGSLVVFLVWVYYSSQTLFFGAELIQARRTRHEWLAEEASHGDTEARRQGDEVRS
jgi:membrane protein